MVEPGTEINSVSSKKRRRKKGKERIRLDQTKTYRSMPPTTRRPKKKNNNSTKPSR